MPRFKILIFSEDQYGPKFFQKLLQRLRREGFIPTEMNVTTGPRIRNCYAKTQRAIKAALGDFDRVILVIDGDGNPEQARRQIQAHLPADEEPRIGVVVTQYEIEEWICYSDGIRFGSEKPSQVLHKKHAYEKFKLPQYADKLDLQRLRDMSESFRYFLKEFETG